MSKKDEEQSVTIIKKVNKIEGGHHGGAWKVAYADFVTAMMAFFLLMWLLNVTTDVQKNAISNYFDPTFPKASNSESGSGGVLGGMTMSPDGAMVSNVQNIAQPQVPDTTTRGNKSGDMDTGEFETEGYYADGDPDSVDIRDPEEPKEEDNNIPSVEQVIADLPEPISEQELQEMSNQQIEDEIERIENENFGAAKQEILAALDQDPGLAALKDHLMFEITPEGMRIQIIDKQGRSMFPSGSADMHEFMAKLLEEVGSTIQKLPNQVSISGHTDSVPYPEGAKYTNWELSADRANSSRRVLLESGFPLERVHNVVGKADKDHLIPDNPRSEQNRRISILLLRDRLTRPATERPTLPEGQLDEIAPVNEPESQESQETAAETQAEEANEDGPILETQPVTDPSRGLPQVDPIEPTEPETDEPPLETIIPELDQEDRKILFLP